MYRDAQGNVVEDADAPDWAAAALERERRLERMVRDAERSDRAFGHHDLAARGRSLIARSRQTQVRLAAVIRAHGGHLDRAPLPRRTPPPRAAARRPAARRAAGPRSGQDPGDDGEPERPAPRRGELRHISAALDDFLADRRPEGGDR